MGACLSNDYGLCDAAATFSPRFVPPAVDTTNIHRIDRVTGARIELGSMEKCCPNPDSTTVEILDSGYPDTRRKE